MGLVNLVSPYYLTALKHRMPKISPWDRMVNTVEPGVFDPLNYTLIMPTFDSILEYGEVKESFSELCFKRSEQLKNLNVPVFVFYSGGIDSSVIVETMLNTWSKEDLKRVSIVMLSTSIIENPIAWKKIYKIFKDRIYSAFDSTEITQLILDTPNSIVVNGELADQLFGSDVIFQLEHHMDWDSIFEPWQAVIPTFYYDMFHKRESHRPHYQMSKADVKEFFLDIVRTTKKCPFELKTAFDFLWWFNYTNKGQTVYTRFLTKFPDMNVLYREERIVPFFYTMDFLRWAIDNHEGDKKILKTKESYKIEAKKHLYELTKDKDYLEKKQKIGSLGNLLLYYNLTGNIKMGIDTEWNYLTLEEVLPYVRT